MPTQPRVTRNKKTVRLTSAKYDAVPQISVIPPQVPPPVSNAPFSAGGSLGRFMLWAGGYSVLFDVQIWPTTGAPDTGASLGPGRRMPGTNLGTF